MLRTVLLTATIFFIVVMTAGCEHLTEEVSPKTVKVIEYNPST